MPADGLEEARALTARLWHDGTLRGSADEHAEIAVLIGAILETCPDSEPVACELATAYNAVTLSIESQQRCWVWIERLADLQRRFPGSTTITWRLTQALCQASLDLPTVDGREAVAGRIAELREPFPEHQRMAEDLALALRAAISSGWGFRPPGTRHPG